MHHTLAGEHAVIDPAPLLLRTGGPHALQRNEMRDEGQGSNIAAPGNGGDQIGHQRIRHIRAAEIAGNGERQQPARLHLVETAGGIAGRAGNLGNGGLCLLVADHCSGTARSFSLRSVIPPITSPFAHQFGRWR